MIRCARQGNIARQLRKGEGGAVKKYFSLLLAILIFMVIHEGIHAVLALLFDEYQAFQVHSYGLEVIYRTPIADRAGIKWGFIAGSSNIFTLAVGYVLFCYREKTSLLRNPFLRLLSYWSTLVFLLLDPLNLSIMPFFFGGDIGGIVRGFGFNKHSVQAVFLAVLLINRELIIHRIFPLFGVENKHPLFKPLLKKGFNAK